MKKIFTLIVLLAAAVGVQAEETETWTVAGVATLCGTNWDPSDATNDMALQSDGTYKWEKKDVVLEKGVTYAFKVVKNHSWDEAYPGQNYSFTVDATGKYTVVITFDPANEYAVSHTATKTGDAQVGEKTWTIAGESDLMGSNWDPTDTSNDMTKQSDGTYKLVKTGVALLADVEYKFKVLANHSWGENYGLNGQPDGANIVLTVDADATYDVTFTFNPDTKIAAATASVASGITPVVAPDDATAPRYDLSGRRVNEGYRGVVIQNGRKVVK